MIRRVNMPEYNPSLLGGLNWGGGSFARSQYLTAVYNHDLLPQRRDSEILSRLRRHTVYPIPRTIQEPCYRRDHRAMRPIYECPDNNVSAKSADDCARISTLQSYHYSAVKIFSNRLIVTSSRPKRYRRTDRQTNITVTSRATQSIAR